jgi:hypothetical protein
LWGYAYEKGDIHDLASSEVQKMNRQNLDSVIVIGFLFVVP